MCKTAPVRCGGRAVGEVGEVERAAEGGRAGGVAEPDRPRALAAERELEAVVVAALDQGLEVEVPALSVQTLLAKHRITKIDLLLTDVQGYDPEVVEQFLA